MALGYKAAEKVYQETLGKITESRDEWISFLNSSTWMFEYSFGEQILIYSQRPNAKACATMEDWNKKASRWVKRDSKGITIMKYENGQNKLELLFDIADTYPIHYANVGLWQLDKNRQWRELTYTLVSKYGDFKKKSSLEESLVSAIDNFVEDSLIEYFEEFKNIVNKGSLTGVEEEELKFIYTETIRQNLIYTVFTRCDLDPFTVLPNYNFEYITYFDSVDTINNIGVATRDLSRDMIREIRAFVKNKKERGDLNEHRLQSSERLPNTKYRNREQRNNNNGQIRTNEGEILERKQTMYVRANEDDRNTNTALELDTENLRGESSKNNRTNETTREYNRGNEREKSNAVGRNDEQLENDSRIDDTRRNDIQLDSLLSENEQKQVITGVENTSAFSFSQEMIDSVLCEGSQFEKGKFRIYKQLTSISTSKENIEFLKSEYGIGGRSADSNGINENHSTKGIILAKGYNANAPQLKLSWSEVEKRIKELIRLDRYMNSKEKEEYEKWFLNQQEIVIETKDDNIKKEYLYLKGDRVFIGSIEYEIVVISSEEVLLSEVQYPLLVKEMSFAEFDRKAKENPYNTHLIKSNRNEVITNAEEKVPKEKEDAKEFIENIFFKCYSDLEIYVYENPNTNLLEVELKDEEKYSPQLVLTHILNEIEDGTFKVTELEKSRILEELRNVRKQEKEYVIGKTVNYDNGVYTIKDVIEVNDGEDEVVLENNDTKETTTDTMGFAIYLVEEQENKEKEKIEIPKIKKQRKSRIEHYDLHSEIPLAERNNYKITNNTLGTGTPKEKYARNIAAIKVLKRCQEENRYATKEEQEVLANYVGWGGLPDVFDRDKTNWSKEYEELKTLLTEKEYNEARQSTLTAFYTPPVVIKAIYQTLENIGLEQGNILEPSCGIGNFMGMLPDSLNKCKLYGVEIDSISGEIARQLYQKNTIAVKGFEEVDMPDSFFDVAVGNVPFGDYKLADKRYDKNNFLIHDYFYAKTLDKVRSDGVIAFITSKGTMDKKNNSFRKYIAQRAELLGAIRLANDVFTDNAGTKTTTDIIFLQKKDKITDIEPSWLNLGIDENGIEMNQYFIDNPNMILGKMEMVTSQYGMKSDCIPFPNANLEELLNNAIKNINAEIRKYEIDEISVEENNTIPALPTVRNYTYAVVDDKIYYRENSIMYLQEVPLTTEKRIKSMVEIRDSLRNLIELQTEDASDEEIKQEQEKLNLLYDKFTATYGIINSRANEKAFAEDDSYYLLCSLEILKDNGEFDRKADMFYKRTIKASRQVSMADNAVDALILSISNKACVDMEYMKLLTGKSEEELARELEGSIYKDPIDDVYVTADEYLSGNVREKLKIAQKFAENDDSFKVNVEALEKVKPRDLTASEISVRLGTTWIPTSDIEDFIYELLDTSNYLKYSIKVRFSEYTSEWNISGKSEDRGNVKANHTYGTNRINAYKIIENTLNLRDVKIFDNIINEEGKEERVFNAKETAIAQARQELIKNKFQDWIWKDQARRERLVNFYNENFNNIKLREYDGQYIVFNGMNPEIALKKHQLDAVARILYGGNTLLAHEVRSRKNI